MTFDIPTRRALCEACTLAEKMKDCPACDFFIESPRATPEDVSRMWVRLWGDKTPEQVRAITEHEDIVEKISIATGVPSRLIIADSRLSLDTALSAQKRVSK